MNFEKSIELHERSSRSLAGGVSSHHRRGELPVPLFFDRAKGSRLFDVDGNEFIDYIMGNGAAIFGHSPDFLLDSRPAGCSTAAKSLPVNTTLR